MNKGITLIALVITIIVMLILAGVGLRSILGIDGLIGKISKSEEIYNNASQNEVEKIDELQNYLNSLGGNSTEPEDLAGPEEPTGPEEPELPPIEKPTEETTTEFDRANGIIEIAWLDLNNNVITNPLDIGTTELAGLTPVKWTESYNGETTTTATDTEWYNYIAQTGETPSGGTSKWANAKAISGANEVYFVWIPKYAYKIIYFNNEINKNLYRQDQTNQTALDGIIGYSCIYGLVNVTGKLLTGSNPSNVTGTVKTKGYEDYIPHPAFEFDGAKKGIWVGKYEVSGSTSTITIKPNVASLRSITASNIFTASQGVTTTYSLSSDSHMMKNVEWGAVAYLTESKYGRNGTEIYMNNSSSYITGNSGGSTSASVKTGTTNAYNTAKGILASTTGNIYGIYDLSGGSFEYVAGYVYKNSSSTVVTNGNNTNLVNGAVKYKDIYAIGATDTDVNNYKANKGMKGDAVYETSTSSGIFDSNGWNFDWSAFPNATIPVICRGRRMQ